MKDKKLIVYYIIMYIFFIKININYFFKEKVYQKEAMPMQWHLHIIF